MKLQHHLLLIITFLHGTILKESVPLLQWHLNNSKFPGNDVNVLPVWNEGVRGEGVTVCIIDDGVDFNHPDLKGSLRPDLSHDFNSAPFNRIPNPRNPEDTHGPRCAGQIAAHSGVCGGSGVAPGASISALRLLGDRINAQKEAAAITYRNDLNDIYSCSWGPADDGKTVEGPDRIVLEAFISGLLKGRKGRGSLFVFAAGNGQLGQDNCNYDGYANGPFSITIGAIGADNLTPYYMEECAAMFAVTYSSGGQSKSDLSLPKISTIDVNYGCTDRHSGTSAAAPLAAGIMALALSVRPELTWRDVQHLLVITSIPFNLNHSVDSTWITNGANRPFSTRFGYGKIDAHRLVSAARTLKLKKYPQIRSFPWILVKRSIEAAYEGSVTSHLNLDYAVHWNYFELADIEKLERVTVSVQVQHGRRGDLIFILCSPSGTCVPLTSTRPKDDDSLQGLMGWTFSTVAFWDETEILGTWSLQIINKPHHEGFPLYSGQFIQWRLTLWGESTEEAHSTAKYSHDQFSMDCLNNYFPPTSDYFTDRHGIWNHSNNEKKLNYKQQQQQQQKQKQQIDQGPENRKYFGFISFVVFLTLSISFILFLFFTFLRS